MKRILLVTIFAFLLIAGTLLYFKPGSKPSLNNLPKANINTENSQDIPQISVIAENLHVPWGIAFLPASQGGPDGDMLVTERLGTVRLVNSSGLQAEPVANIPAVKEIGEGGLLGIALHPQFESNNYVYLYYTYDEIGGDTRNRVSRFTFKNYKLTNEKIVVDNIPGGTFHNGGRIKFGPDKFLYITTGDAENPSQAQDKNSLAGKILKVTTDGKSAPGNHFNNLVYSYGHRNPQGIVWDTNGRLWVTEHGQSAQDELNKIESGKNYGWPVIRGNESRTGMETPVVNSNLATWAPAGAAIINNVIYFGGLRGSSLYSADLSQNPLEVREHFKNEFGRVRDVVTGLDGMLYITTSNTDGRGNPQENDDKILRINPAKLN